MAAASLGESKEEPETANARRTNTAVRRIRVFVVVDLMCDLMGANRTTFECGTIPLVGSVTGKNREM